MKLKLCFHFKCWSKKPKNRPSFRIILSHLEIAGAELLMSSHETHCEKQKSWQKEIHTQLQTDVKNNTRTEQDLIKRRQDEFKHAKDIR